MDLLLDILASGPAFVGNVIASIVATVLLAIAVGPPMIIDSGARRILHTYWPLLVTFCVILYLLSILCKYVQRRRVEGVGGPGLHARAGRHGTAVAAEHYAVDSHDITDSFNTTINNTTVNGIADEMRRNRNRPDDVRSTMRAVGDFVNAGDPYWRREFGTDGSFRLIPRTPDAHLHRPLRIELQTQTPPGAPALLDLWQQAIESQQPVTLDENTVKLFRSSLGDDVMHDSTEHPGMKMELTVQAQPLAPPKRYMLRIPETGASLSNLELGQFVLPDGRLRLTNRNDQNAPVWLWIDYDMPSKEAIEASGPDGAVLNDAGTPTITLETRPVPGRTARHLLALYDVIRSLCTARRAEIIDDATGTVEFILYGALPQGLTPQEDRFAEALKVVQDAFSMTTFDLSGQPDKVDMENLAYVAEVVRTGEIAKNFNMARITFTADGARDLLVSIDEEGVIHLTSDGEGQDDDIVVGGERYQVTLLGTTVDLGPWSAKLGTTRVVGDLKLLRAQVAALRADETLVVDIAPANASDHRIRLAYSRYMPQQKAS